MMTAKTQGKRALAAAAVVFAWPVAVAPARADDSTAEVAIGGLTLLKTDAIAMDSEDLYISPNIVRVKYRFTNTADSPIDALVAFPLPDIPPADNPWVDDYRNFWSEPSELEFKTSVDGQPLGLQRVKQAFFKGEDVTARLSALNIPLRPPIIEAITSLPGTDRDRLAAAGLIQPLATHPAEARYWGALWTLRTTVTGHQTFPPRKTITVEHEYVPVVDEVFDDLLDLEVRRNLKDAKDFVHLIGVRRRYCIGDGWLHSFDKKAENKKLFEAIEDTTLGYVLTTGANWKGPIGDFHLVVDKGRPDSLGSFCAEGVKQISPTQFEVRHTNFTPKDDLNILFIDV